jgi:hypothetical protein
MATKKDENQQTSAAKFYCEFCDYGTSKKSNYDAHLFSRRHSKICEMETLRNQIQPNSAKFGKTQLFCDICKKTFWHRSGLWKHKKKCEFAKQVNADQTNAPSTSFEANNELIMMLLKEHNDMKTIIVDLLKNGTNNYHYNTTNTYSENKSFNLQIFLNETCKNAMNITEFADSIQLQLNDLENVGELGYIEGISSIIVKNLKAMDITERPIHCADKKREVIYIKDENKWEKEDEDKMKLKKIIKKIACKNQRLLMKFKEIHPDCNYSESKYSDHYSKLVIEAMGGTGGINEDEKAEKIIKNISKEIIIDKNIHLVKR